MAPVDDTRVKRTSDQIGAEILGIVQLPELNFDDDDEETQVLDLEASSASAARHETIIPPRVHEGDVYMLTKQHLRFKAGIVPMASERVNLDEIMRAPSEPPPDRDTTPMRDSSLDRDTLEDPQPVLLLNKPNSLAPVAVSYTDPPRVVSRPTVPAVPRVHPGYAVTLGALAVAAVGVLFLPTASARRPLDSQQPVAAAQPVSAVEVVEAKPIELTQIDIVGTIEPRTAPIPGQLAAVVAPQAAAPAAEPPIETAAPVAAELPPVAPPAEVQIAPFDKSAASSALNAALSAAASCRKEGTPNFPFNITVTFAPSGVVTNAVVNGPPFAGTPTGGCIAKSFRSARVNPFEGPAVTINKTYQLP